MQIVVFNGMIFAYIFNSRFDLKTRNTISDEDVQREWDKRSCKFFGNMGKRLPNSFFLVPNENKLHFAHNGFVYALFLTNNGKTLLISGAGDGLVKIWNINENVPHLLSSIKIAKNGNLTFKLSCLFTPCTWKSIFYWKSEWRN